MIYSKMSTTISKFINCTIKCGPELILQLLILRDMFNNFSNDLVLETKNKNFYFQTLMIYTLYSYNKHIILFFIT